MGWVLLADVAALGLGFIAQPLLARTLGAAGLGLYTLCVTLASFALLPGNLGLSQSLVRVAATVGDLETERQQVSVGVLLSAGFGTTVAILVFVFRGPIADALNAPELLLLLPVLAISFPFASIFVSIAGVLNGRRSMASYALLGTFHRIAAVTFVLVFVLAGRGSIGAIWGLVLAEIALGVCGLLSLRYRIVVSSASIQRYTSGLLSFGAKMAATNAANTVMTHVDVFMVGYFLTTADVGYYGVAVLVASLVPMIPHAVQRLVFPAAAKCWAVQDIAGMRTLVWKSMQFSACIVTLLGIGLAFFGGQLIVVFFGIDFSPAIAPFLILLVARVLRGGTVVPAAIVLSAMGRPDINLKVEGVAVALNIVLNALLIPKMGLPGAALATTVSLLVAASISVVAMVRLAGIDVHVGWYSRLFGMAAVIVMSYEALRGHPLAVVIGAGLFATMVAYMLVFLLSREDRVWLRKTIAALWSKIPDKRG